MTPEERNERMYGDTNIVGVDGSDWEKASNRRRDEPGSSRFSAHPDVRRKAELLVHIKHRRED